MNGCLKGLTFEGCSGKATFEGSNLFHNTNSIPNHYLLNKSANVILGDFARIGISNQAMHTYLGFCQL